MTTDRDLMALPSHRRPPEGMIWQCGACGKRAEDSYGFVGWHSGGWDESCMLNCHPVPDTRALRRGASGPRSAGPYSLSALG